ncbi:MAG: hypothetical protein KGR48_15905, partial [Alphaproteobacteria bacterium]|nr:hypothetical protein [Alphaproteobacteria bacterium]
MSNPDHVGTLATALANAQRLMAANPAAAAEQAAEILKVVPGHPDALLIQGAARLALGDPAGALAVIEPLAAA